MPIASANSLARTPAEICTCVRDRELVTPAVTGGCKNGHDAIPDMSPELVRVDSRKCAEVAAVLVRHTIPAATEEHGNVVGLPASVLPNFYLLAVAICHQTSPVGQVRLGGTLTTGETACG